MNQVAELFENSVQPRYVSTSAGQLRVWSAGAGPSLVVLPGLVMSAEVTARQMAMQFKGWHLTVVELPGIGGSAKIPVHNVQEVAETIFAALNLLGITRPVLLGFDLATSIAVALSRLVSEACELLQIDVEKAKQWVGGDQRLPSLKLREDGTHLV
eukprot:gene29578-51601_t